MRCGFFFSDYVGQIPGDNFSFPSEALRNAQDQDFDGDGVDCCWFLIRASALPDRLFQVSTRILYRAHIFAHAN